jgi:hypothetical protein
MGIDMATESGKKRKKVTGDAEHRTGTLRAAVKPGVVVGKQSVAKVISDYIETKGARVFKRTFWGDKLAQSSAALRSSFKLPANEELYLFANLSTLTQTAGILLSSSGFNMLDGKGGSAHLDWETFANCNISTSRGMLVIGNTGIISPDYEALAELLQAIKAALS